MNDLLHDGGTYGRWPETPESRRCKQDQRERERRIIENLSPTQKAFADRIAHDVSNLLEDNDTVVDLIRGRYSVFQVIDRFTTDLYLGIANYDAVRTEQLRYMQEELKHIMMIMPQPVTGPSLHEGEAVKDAG